MKFELFNFGKKEEEKPEDTTQEAIPQMEVTEITPEEITLTDVPAANDAMETPPTMEVEELPVDEEINLDDTDLPKAA